MVDFKTMQEKRDRQTITFYWDSGESDSCLHGTAEGEREREKGLFIGTEMKSALPH